MSASSLRVLLRQWQESHVISIESQIEPAFLSLPVLVDLYLYHLHSVILQILVHPFLFFGLQLFDVRIMQQDKDVRINSTEELSEREKEVIRLVAMGLANKEIAEKMFIAVNTVMTHRRNISRKLEIHSPAGLTIYAIVNGLIRLEDVKL